MREIVAAPELVAACGLYCGACKSHLSERCDGCAENDRATWCRVRSCCRERGWSSCAECTDFSDPRQCAKFNNFMSKLFAFFLRSDRAACVAQIGRLGLDGHAQAMAEQKLQTIKR
jgi:hypothetical protein